MLRLMVVVQALTYVGLFGALLMAGQWRLGIAQGLLGVVTVLIYWG